MTNDQCNSIRTLVQQVIGKYSMKEIKEDDYLTLREWTESFPYLIAPEGICKAVSKEKNKETHYYLTPISSYVKILKKLVFIDEQCTDLLVQYSDGSAIQEIIVNREMALSKSGVKSLLRQGISFREARSEAFLGYLLYSDLQAPIGYAHCRLGWLKQNNSYIFRGYESISSDNLPVSHYCGSLNLTPHGEIEKWLNMVESDVLPYIPLTFCMLLGFASPVLSRLYQKHDLGSLVFDISNESSRGKTTAAMLASSVFSCPILGQGTVRSFHATQNFLTKYLSDVSGFTVVLDEGATYKGDFNDLFYLIAAGEEKGRLGKDGMMKESLSWNNVVITTAEFLPVDDDSTNGIRTRCFNITDDMTKNAAHADSIKATISENYGLAGNVFIQWLLTLSDDDLESDYQLCQQILYNAIQDAGMTESPFTNRVFSKLAIVLQVADYVCQCLDLDINTKDLIQYIIKIERNVSAQTDPVQRTLDIILAEISRNSYQYISDSNLQPSNCVGKIEQNGEHKMIAILKTEFSAICRRNALQPLSVLKSLRERQMLDCEGDRLSKRIRLQRSLPPQVCYVIKIFDPKVNEPRKDWFENE